MDRLPKPTLQTSVEATALLLFKLLKQNPALSLTLLYLFTILLGSLYQWTLLRRFNINAVDFVQVNDLLLAAFRDLTTFPNALLGIFVWTLMFVRHPLRWWLAKVASLGLLGLVVLYFPVVFALNNARNIKRGWGTYARIELAHPSEAFTNSPTLMLLATSQAYLFLFDRASQRHYVIPTDNVAVLRVCRGEPDHPCTP